jgi:SOS-response transcriptional repressor LexA
MVTQLLSGDTELSMDVAKRICEAYRCSLDYLVFGRESESLDFKVSETEAATIPWHWEKSSDCPFARIPLMADSAAAGDATVVEDGRFEDDPVILYASWLPRRARNELTCLRVRGQSMTPGWPDGTIVLVDHRRNQPGIEVARSARVAGTYPVVAARIELDDGQIGCTIKMLREIKGAWLLEPTNRSFEPRIIPKTERDWMAGLVITWWARSPDAVEE